VPAIHGLTPVARPVSSPVGFGGSPRPIWPFGPPAGGGAVLATGGNPRRRAIAHPRSPAALCMDVWLSGRIG
jgi:hypothetical protein